MPYSRWGVHPQQPLKAGDLEHKTAAQHRSHPQTRPTAGGPPPHPNRWAGAPLGWPGSSATPPGLRGPPGSRSRDRVAARPGGPRSPGGSPKGARTAEGSPAHPHTPTTHRPAPGTPPWAGPAPAGGTSSQPSPSRTARAKALKSPPRPSLLPHLTTEPDPPDDQHTGYPHEDLTTAPPAEPHRPALGHHKGKGPPHRVSRLPPSETTTDTPSHCVEAPQRWRAPSPRRTRKRIGRLPPRCDGAAVSHAEGSCSFSAVRGMTPS